MAVGMGGWAEAVLVASEEGGEEEDSEEGGHRGAGEKLAIMHGFSG